MEVHFKKMYGMSAQDVFAMSWRSFRNIIDQDFLRHLDKRSEYPDWQRDLDRQIGRETPTAVRRMTLDDFMARGGLDAS